MNYRQIIADSWRHTQNNKGLIYWFGFLPSILTTTVGIGYLAYQFFAFKRSYLFDDSETSFLSDVSNFGWNFISSHASLSVPLVVVAIIVTILWFLVPTLTEASAIQAIARSKNNQKSGVGIGLKYGIMAFLPLFEFHLLVKTFTPMSLVTEMGFVLRNLGMGAFKIFLPVFIVILIIALILHLLFTYAGLYIVIDDEGVFASMKKSAKLVILNWQHTILITILMIIIGVRIIIQAILVFLIPAIVIFTAGFLATLALETTVLIVAGILGLAALLLAAYLGGVVDIFSYTVWTYTFLELTGQKEVSARDEVSSARGVVSTAPEIPVTPLEVPAAPVVPVSAKPATPPVEITTPVEIPKNNPPPELSEPSDDSIPGLL
ncbi:MAG: hypothetical protein WC604_00900 [Candidatus Gracilibacteria bacterium]